MFHSILQEDLETWAAPQCRKRIIPTISRRRFSITPMTLRKRSRRWQGFELDSLAPGRRSRVVTAKPRRAPERRGKANAALGADASGRRGTVVDRRQCPSSRCRSNCLIGGAGCYAATFCTRDGAAIQGAEPRRGFDAKLASIASFFFFPFLYFFRHVLRPARMESLVRGHLRPSRVFHGFTIAEGHR